MNHWQAQPSSQGTHYAFTDSASKSLKDALETCAAKAISVLDQNIQDDSLYLLFEWNASAAELTIVVTDADKQQDSPFSVGAQFTALQHDIQSLPIAEQAEKIEATNELIKFLLSDYLASCSVFFSLLAGGDISFEQ